MNEELKKLLGEELAKQVLEKIGDKKLIVNDGTYIPKHRLDEVIQERDEQKKLVEKAEKNLELAKEAAGNTTTLGKQIEELQRKASEEKIAFEKSTASIKKSMALQEALLNAGVLDATARKLLAKEFDVEKLEVNEANQIKGFDEMLKPIKENKVLSNLFGEVKMAGQQHGQGGSPDASLAEYATSNPFSSKTLNIAKQIELKKTKPELAAKLESLAQQ